MLIASFFWWDGEGGNVDHIAQHGLTQEDVEFLLRQARPGEVEESRSSGDSRVVGRLPDGRLINVIFEDLGDGMVNPVTAYEIED